MAIPSANVLGNPNVTEGNFQIALEQLRESVLGSGKAYDSANTYSQYDTCVYSGVSYYSKINSNTGNTPAIGTNWGLESELIKLIASPTTNAIPKINADGTIGNGNIINDTNGNVGIDVAPSAWNGASKALQVGTVGIQNDIGLNVGSLSTNSYYNNTNHRYIYSLAAARYTQYNGSHTWQTAPGGTAGNVIPWTNAMILNASGNLLVGTSTDNGVDKLQVNGSIKSIRNGRNIGQLLNISYNDNLSHNLGSGFANNNFLIEITSASGLHTIPVYSYGGDGIAYRWNALNPDTGSWINSGASSLVLTFTERGINPNTYSLTLSNSNGSLTIQATTKNNSYNIAITTI